MTSTLQILGCRGSIGVSGNGFARHGGATTALRLQTPEGVLHIDAGTGLVCAPPPDPGQHLVLLLTHAHWDHVCGLPHFSPLYAHNAPFEILAVPRADLPPRALLSQLCRAPFFPIDPAANPHPQLRFAPLAPTGSLERLGIRIDWMDVPHPGGASAFRLTVGTTTLVFAPDCELSLLSEDSFARFAHNADHLLIDAHFADDELPSRSGWGHSSPTLAARFAAQAQVDQLWLFHHAPWRTDDAIDALVHVAQQHHPRTRAAHQGLTLTLDPDSP